MWRPLETATTLAKDAYGVATALRETFRSDASTAKPSSLGGEQGKPSTTGLLSPFRASVGENLKPDRLASILRAAINGDADQYLVLAEEMEEREPHYRSVLGTRKLAVAGLEINVGSASDSAHDKAIAADVEDLLRRTEAEALVIDLMDGVSKGFSNVEIMWERDVRRWEPTAYKHRSARHFVWDQDSLEVCGLRTLGSIDGEPLKPFKWIQHRPKLTSGVPLRSGLALPIALCYMAKRYTVADWLTFLDIFGMPVRIGKFPASMAKRTKELLRAVQAIGTDAAAIIPDEMKIEFLNATGSGGSGNHFIVSAEYWDKQTSKVVLGQTMSSDDGSSLAQAKVHNEVRHDILGADSRAVMGTLRRDLVIPFIQLNYGPQKLYPTLRQKTRPPEDIKTLAEVTRVFVNQGGRIQESEARDRIGYSEPDDGARLLQPEAKVQADAQPKPDPAAKPPAPGSKAPVDDKAKPADKSLNSQVRQLVELLASKPRADGGDIVDEMADEDLSDWEPMLEGNVAKMLELVQGAETFEEAASLVAKLAEDEGVVLDFDTFQDALARSTFKSRGVGSATDKT